MVVLTHLDDPLVWLKVVQVAGFSALAAMLWLEPMVCGGANRAFHRILAALAAAKAAESLVLATVRSILLAQGPDAIPLKEAILTVELATTAALIAAVVSLSYQAYRWQAYNLIKRQPAERRCKQRFEP